MINLLKTLAGLGLFLAFVVATFYWFEAEKEVRILCSMFHEGQSETFVTRTLDTGHFLEYQHEKVNGEESIRVSTPYTLSSSRCTVQLASDGMVQSARYYQPFSLNKTAARIGVPVLLFISVFQLLLMAGLPYGHLAWGGNHKVLPMGLRIASGITAVVLLLGSFFLLERAGILQVLEVPGLTYYSTWILALLFGLSYFTHRRSKSRLERKWMRPIALLLCGLCIIVSMAG